MNAGAPVTLQYQLKHELLGKISSKEWLPGQMIPSERELCETYEVSRMTVRTAINDLVQSGYLIRKQGKGTYVSVPSIEYTATSTFSLSQALKEKGAESKFYILNYEEKLADAFFQEIFDLPYGESVISLTHLRTIDGRAYAVETAVVPEKYLHGASRDDIDRDGLYPTMKKCSGVFPVEADDNIEPAICPPEIAEIMELPKNTALFRITRYTRIKDACVEYTISHVYGQRYNCKHLIRQP